MDLLRDIKNNMKLVFHGSEIESKHCVASKADVGNVFFLQGTWI
jgi:hypothetical protein